MKVVTKKGLIRIGILLGVLALLSLWGGSCMMGMPGESFAGELPPLTEAEAARARALRSDVEALGGRIGHRSHLAYEGLREAAAYVERRLEEAGLSVRRHTYAFGGKEYDNLEVELRGASRPEEIVVVGAHYDSVFGSPGANDNGSGVAALLWLARSRGRQAPARTLRWLAFVNEEPPHFLGGTMGSLVYARSCRERQEKIVAMMSLETIGYYADADGSQKYPPPLSLFYPSKGNFIAFVGNISSRKLVRRVVGSFRRHASFPSEGAALPGWLEGVGWSDHWSFWEQGYPAVMVTDTAPFRYPDYHLHSDTPEKLDYERFSRVVGGLEAVIHDLVDRPEE